MSKLIVTKLVDISKSYVDSKLYANSITEWVAAYRHVPGWIEPEMIEKTFNVENGYLLTTKVSSIRSGHDLIEFLKYVKNISATDMLGYLVEMFDSENNDYYLFYLEDDDSIQNKIYELETDNLKFSGKQLNTALKKLCKELNEYLSDQSDFSIDIRILDDFINCELKYESTTFSTLDVKLEEN